MKRLAGEVEQSLAVMQGQLDTLSQQATTFAANDEAAQTDEAAQSAQLDDLAQQVDALAAADEATDAGEVEQDQRLAVMQGQLGYPEPAGDHLYRER